MSFRVANDILLSESALGADKRTEILDMSNLYGLSAQVTYTGTYVGVLKIEVSNDGINFAELSTPTTSLSAAGTYVINLDNVFYKYARFFLDHSSGSATTLELWHCAKGM